MRRISLLLGLALLGSLIAVVEGLRPGDAAGASHREAPAISKDPTADISDFFFFRSYEEGEARKVVLIMDVIPGEEPSSGPNYYSFDPNARYMFHVDNDMDGKADDVSFEFRFRDQQRGVPEQLDLFLPFVALPPITALEGAGSEGFGIRQVYTVTMIKKGQRRVLGRNLISPPPNVGPRTTPDPADLAQQGIHDLGRGTRVFAGQRDDPFYIDLGGVFDTLNLRRDPPLLTTGEDATEGANPFGVDMLSGFNVHTIAIELPASILTDDHKGVHRTETSVLGAYASTSRRALRIANGRGVGPWVQVQRLANPLVNEAIIGTFDKDRWNRLRPDREGRFEEYYLNPRLALALETVYGVPAAQTNRTDLRDLLLKYAPGDTRLSELLRFDVSVPPTALAQQKRLGPLAHDASDDPTPDPAAWPNGRRPRDDVTDVAIRVIGGPNYVDGKAGDGVNVNDLALPDRFPFLPTPWDGRDRVHVNP
jgi:Domain of unknown function (DUF4331)